MREVHERMGSPLEQYAAKPEVPEGRDLLSYVSSALSGILSASFAEVPQSELTEAVDLLCDRRLEVHLVGGRFSHLLAGYLAAHLQLLRSGVSDVPQDQFSRFALVADAGRSHALVAFDYRRYDPDTVRLARLFSKAGGKVILLTDQWMSPAADFADAVLPSRVESPSPFDSLVPALALVETLITAVTERLGDRGRGRIELFERQRADLDDDGRDRS
jgi:DNA-binding MurR/RpiR family transcriptional regulator